MSNWYVLQSKPRKERFLMRQLQFHEFQAYCPMQKVKRVNPRAQTLVPYFPGYIFINCDLEKIGITPLQNMPGAVGLVQFGGEAALVSADLVAGIKQKIEHMERNKYEIIDQIKSGEHILLSDGVFAGYEAIFDIHLPGTDRARVLLKLIKDQFVRVDVPLELIQTIK